MMRSLDAGPLMVAQTEYVSGEGHIKFGEELVVATMTSRIPLTETRSTKRSDIAFMEIF